MRQTMTFIPTQKGTPKEAEIPSHIYLVRGGYIKQVAAGIYSYLPLALRSLKKVEAIIRDELDQIGCSELLMPTLHPAELWKESGRWDEYGDTLMRMKDRHEREFALGPTHEEVITFLVRDTLNSYKKLPLALYQIQTKFRDELRPRFGLMRGREFVMKDAYSFHADQASLDEWYNKFRQAYSKIFSRIGLNFRIVEADSGNIGGNESAEFMVLSERGEDTIVYSDASDFAANIEVYNLKEGDPSPDGKGTIRHAKGIEVGHIFKLGTKYSEAMNAYFLDENQERKPILMGCYGIGVSRVLMAAIEQNHDDKGIIWPKAIAPYEIHLIPVNIRDEVQREVSEALYQKLINQGFEVLYDDRDERAGVKFNDADLIGIPIRITIGRKAGEGIVELKYRHQQEAKEVSMDHLIPLLLQER